MHYFFTFFCSIHFSGNTPPTPPLTHYQIHFLQTLHPFLHWFIDFVVVC